MAWQMNAAWALLVDAGYEVVFFVDADAFILSWRVGVLDIVHGEARSHSFHCHPRYLGPAATAAPTRPFLWIGREPSVKWQIVARGPSNAGAFILRKGQESLDFLSFIRNNSMTCAC